MFADFVTDEFVDWQWWDILCHAKVIEMNTAPNALLPFIQSIDTYQHNHKLGIGFEAKLHGGKLLVLAIDTENKIDQRPASLQLLQSISNYVRSEAFRPVVDIDEAFRRPEGPDLASSSIVRKIRSETWIGFFSLNVILLR